MCPARLRTPRTASLPTHRRSAMTTANPLNTSFTSADAAELYQVPNWSGGWFRVSDKGLMEATPAPGLHASLRAIVDEIVDRGESLPVILRFPQVLAGRVKHLNEAFQAAINEYNYSGHYQGVFPIKVNQRRAVVETVAAAGYDYAHGLEAGSKAELALCLAQKMHPDALLCCNGFKDDGFIKLALWGRTLGKNVVITIEKFTELDRILKQAKALGVKPAVGVRFKLHARGSGQWEESGGDQAKFGLNAYELLRVVERLKEENMLDSLVMLHTHIGSQITDIRRVKVAVREAAQTYAGLIAAGADLKYLNVGGGLGVDYDGSKTTFYASMNYTVKEYAADIVYTVQEVCKAREVPEPVIVSESGRALTAHHAVLILPVVDVTGPTRNLEDQELTVPGEDSHQIVRDMYETLENISMRNYRESYNDAVGDKQTLHNLFDLGYVTLEDRARGEALFNAILRKIAKLIQGEKYVPDELEDLQKVLADKFICNFSLFQSLPDNWAIGALFPIVPLDRLNEQPTRQATLVDITCDSDGKVEKFIDLRDVKATLPLHEPGDRPYYLGAFLMGAYQDVLGSAHNLFGKVSEAHVTVRPGGRFNIDLFVRGQKARRMIESMGYEEPMLRDAIEDQADAAIGRGTLTQEQEHELLEDYGEELLGYTYLEYES
ncbi:biosynthetic arginine decarboxylase [Deinococcus radiodurans R1 = ATCC 13939 = DSM 20539]|uniref:Biosynthetic arginine decarboxylase n=2 Tax=Deinococcus radiodurans TaxID=1299 RepID=SPEA_DEIRA|nr:RecName: Full=Biosynthetic arginine decarboxylase; Short=ADC [Deinococcus radiodurans R1 = ATCC 13939 = DSM 20539]AAF09826.1 arginine decarboxylase [Deinococcus radiodurans R1 = ATCC 13939 = DSM 20539]QEM72207.1 biosynthetic arginine decarboxylase [Deinococcus radiodurans]UDK99441.1 biosynthetic arginine decarboxylase [Deinococcus radiodurans R1 = ATCC 13939 = DSM 20539]HCE65484.1 arginine decarboxylase [Deinococcus radiodurans]